MNNTKSYSREELLDYSEDFAIIVYDGKCMLCNRFIQFLIKKDSRKQFKFIAYQAIENYEDHEFSESIELIYKGEHTNKSTAILRSYASLPAPYSWLSILKVFPKSIRDAVYSFIAKNRYKFLGQTEKCIIPDESIQSRFL